MSRRRYEELRKEWSNDNEKPLISYGRGSKHKGIWVCKEGHTYEATIQSRYRGTGCPYCSGRLAIPYVNDLATTHLEIATEWDVNKNDVSVFEVKPYSGIKRWWICPNGHSYQASPAKRVKGKGCPYCHNKRPYKGCSLADCYPEIAAEFDMERNENRPEDYRPSSNQMVYWKCLFGHSWVSAINTRTRKDRPGMCPYCSGKTPIPGLSDLLTTDPALAAEWDDKEITPDQVTRYSHRDVFWKCPNGHRYLARVANRSIGRNCPICNKKRKNK